MKSWKIYNTLFLATSIALTGCGGGGGSEEDTIPEGTLSLANPITDIALVADTALDFSIPADTCTHTAGATIEYSITNVANNVGFSLVNFEQLTGKPDALGDVTVTVTCSAGEQNLTDEFTITVTDFEAAPSVRAGFILPSKSGNTVQLNASIHDTNLSGSIVSYLWEQVSGPEVTITDADKIEASFIAPNVFEETTLSFKITATDNAGLTASDTTEVEITSPSEPDLSVSFPLALGEYNEDKLDMFGTVEAVTGDDVASVVLTIDNIDYTATVTDSIWRVSDATLTEKADINVKVTTTAGYIKNEKLSVNYNDLYKTTIDKNITDIAVNESRGEIYVQVAGNDGDLVSDSKIAEFNLSFNNSEYVEVSRTSTFEYPTSIPTGLTFDTNSGDLLVSYTKAVTKIDLSSNRQTVISDANNGTGTEPSFIADISYNKENDVIYATDVVAKKIYTIDPSTGNRENFNFATLSDKNFLSVLVNSAADTLYFSLNTNLTETKTVGYADTDTGSLQAALDATGPVSDLALNEASNELFYVDTTNALIKVDLYHGIASVVIPNLFKVESISNETSPMIGLHYDSKRKVIFAAGRDADGTNKLLVIDPVSGDYAKIATGDSDQN